MRTYIADFWKSIEKSSAPWLNDTCRAAIAFKHASVNTPLYEQSAKECAQVIRSTRASYLVKLKEYMSRLPRGSKRWWSLNKQLLHRQAAPSFFPPLKDSHGVWYRKSADKANLFAEVWQKKSQLFPESVGHFLHRFLTGCQIGFLSGLAASKIFSRRFGPIRRLALMSFLLES